VIPEGPEQVMAELPVVAQVLLAEQATPVVLVRAPAAQAPEAQEPMVGAEAAAGPAETTL